MPVQQRLADLYDCDGNVLFMKGTERTGKFTVVAASEVARVGFREYEPGSFRIRVEPSSLGLPIDDSTMSPANDWKQPGQDDQPRYSICTDADGLNHLIGVGLQAVLGNAEQWQINPDAPGPLTELAAKAAVDAALPPHKVLVPSDDALPADAILTHAHLP